MKEDPIDYEKATEVIATLHSLLLQSCIYLLKEHGPAHLADKNLLIHVFMCDVFCDYDENIPNENFKLRLWVDRAVYVDEQTLELLVTEAGPEVSGRKQSERLEGTQQRLLLRLDGMWMAPIVPIAYMMALCSKIWVTLNPEKYSEEIITAYDDEALIIKTLPQIQSLIEQMTNGSYTDARPIS